MWFSDEARFGQQGTITRIWVLRGSRPRVLRQTKYEWLYVIGAVCPQTGNSSGLLSPYINAEIMNIYLQQFSQEIAQDAHAVLIWDQAGFHKSSTLKIPQNITIIPLPPYSPELNPIENLWHYLRSQYWPNRSYANYDDLRLAACDAWQAVCLDPKLVKSISRCTYIERTD